MGAVLILEEILDIQDITDSTPLILTERTLKYITALFIFLF